MSSSNPAPLSAPTCSSEIPSPAHNSASYALQPLSPLLSLPTELRLQIYTPLLILPPSTLHTFRSLYSRVGSYTRLHRSELTPTLLLTCRQINLEATPLLYSHSFTAHPTLLTSLPYLNNPGRPILLPGPISRITRWYIRIRLDADAGHTVAKMKAAFDGARELVVDVYRAAYVGGAEEEEGYAMLRCLEGVRGVGRAEVRLVEGMREDYGKWLEERMMSREGEQEGEGG